MVIARRSWRTHYVLVLIYNT